MLAGLMLAGLMAVVAAPLMIGGGEAEDDSEDDPMPDTPTEGDDMPQDASDPWQIELAPEDGDQLFEHFDAKRDQVTLTLESWDFQIGAAHEDDGSATLTVVGPDYDLELTFASYEDPPYGAIELVIAEPGQAPVYLGLEQTGAPLAPVDPDAPDLPPDDLPDSAPLAPVDPDAPDTPSGEDIGEPLDPILDDDAPPELEGFVPGQDKLQIIVQEGNSPTVEVSPSYSGEDAVVRIDGDVRAILRGVPEASVEDIVILPEPDAA